MKKNILSILGIGITVFMFVSSIVFSSCEDYLDIDEYIYDRTTIDSVFISKLKLFEYVNGIVVMLPYEGTPHQVAPETPAGGADDDWFSSLPDNLWLVPSTVLLLDQATPDNYVFAGFWSKMYQGIRKANIAIARIGECKELTDMEFRDYTGRLYFMRAYFYYSLLRHYGPIPILPDQAFDADEEAENVRLERDTWNDCAEYIYKNMEEAAKYLPVKRDKSTEFIPTQGAARSIMARLKLFQASKWYNGNTRYANWTKKDGRHYISQEYNPDLWGEAAVEYHKIIRSNAYKLYTVDSDAKTRPLPSTVPTAPFPAGAGGIDPYLSYKGIFDGSIMSFQNEELIYYQPAQNDNIGVSSPGQIGGSNVFNVTLDMIDQYRFADGRQYSEGTDAERSWEAVGARIEFGGNYIIGDQTAVRDAYREPRFYASIGYNHCIWPGNSYNGTRNDWRNFQATYYSDGTAQATEPNQYNHTGYTSRKFMHQDDLAHWDSNIKKVKVMPVIRYAEILLGYVEALNEMENPISYKNNPNDPNEVPTTINPRDANEMVYYFNMIRFRAGLPGITVADASDKEKMTELIRQERRVEFAFEVHRYHDLRRWGIAQEYIDARPMGLNVLARSSERERFYTPVILDRERCHRRVFTQKMYFYVIPKRALDKNDKLVQNPGW